MPKSNLSKNAEQIKETREEKPAEQQIEVGEDLADERPLGQIEFKDSNYDVRWCNAQMMDMRKRQGWIPCTQEEVKTFYPKHEGQSADTSIKYRDVVLCKRKKEIGEKYRQRNRTEGRERMQAMNEWVEKATESLRSGSERKIAESLEQFNQLRRR